jgi:hypothetical protein
MLMIPGSDVVDLSLAQARGGARTIIIARFLSRHFRWSAEDLARESAVSVATIRRAELADKQTLMNAANDPAIRRVLEAAGVEFIDGYSGEQASEKKES